MHGATVLEWIPEDGMITYENVRLKSTVALELKQRQIEQLAEVSGTD